MVLKEINCVDKTTRLLSEIEYSKDGKTIFSRTDKGSEWYLIIPDTVDDALHKEICKQPKK